MGHAMAHIIAETGRTRWIHWGYSGINLLAPFRSIGAELVVTTSKGLCSFMIADYVIMVMHMLLRRFPRLMKNQQDKRWSQGPYISLRGKTLGIIGLGNIGQRVARKASVFDMRVIGLARRPMVVGHVEQIFLADQMQAFFQSSDIVVIAVPLTAETRGMIGAGQIGWMQPHSYIVNVARGHILDEEALVKALKNGHLAGAALDAFAQEPLPPESELWHLPNVIITPHTSGWTEDYPDMVRDLFCDNLAKLLQGKPMTNVADLSTAFADSAA